MANVIDSLTFGDSTGIFSIPFGTCSTRATTAAKTVTLTNFVLETGAQVRIKFTYANSAANPTLNVNNSGAKSIYWHGAALASSQYWGAGAVLDFVYNGTQWELIGIANAFSSTLSIANGGTGATTAAQALTNLGITAGTTDLQEGVSKLNAGAIYLVLES